MCSFWFQLTNLALVWEPQSTPPMDPKKEGMRPRPCSSVCTLPWPAPCTLHGPLLPSGPMSNKLLYSISIPYGLLFSCVSPSHMLGLHLTNVNLTQSQ